MSHRRIAERNVLVWHVHGSWTTAFVRGGHSYLLPALADGGEWGRGRSGRPWPSAAREVAPGELAECDVDLVVLQRVDEIELAERWLGRVPGSDVAAVFVEHNTPRNDIPNTRHPLAEQDSIPIVHVTHFNALMWDCGRAPTIVIPHGVVDTGELYTGELERIAVAINEPVRRWRVTGTDLLPAFAVTAPIDLYGIGVDEVNAHTGVSSSRLNPMGDLAGDEFVTSMAQRRLYLHTARWTSLGHSLLEAMCAGMPVVALAATEAPRAVPREAGVVSADIAELDAAVAKLIHDPELAARMGRQARQFALTHYGLDTFLQHWDGLLARLT